MFSRSSRWLLFWATCTTYASSSRNCFKIHPLPVTEFSGLFIVNTICLNPTFCKSYLPIALQKDIRLDVIISCIVNSIMYSVSGPGSSVGIATNYGLDGPGIESRWVRDFSNTSRPALRPTQPPVQWAPGLLPGVKRPGRGADHPPPSSTEVKKEYSYTSTHPLGHFRPVTGWPYLIMYSVTECWYMWNWPTQPCQRIFTSKLKWWLSLTLCFLT
jgi:hypothetical protein